MKRYIQRDLNDPTKFKIEERSKADKNTICIAPGDEPIEHLDIIDDIDPLTGEARGKKAVVNEDKKATALAAKAQEESDAVMDRLRSKRNELLTETDFTQLADVPMNEAKKTEYAAYRQVLRDLPTNTVDPASPQWPTKPE